MGLYSVSIPAVLAQTETLHQAYITFILIMENVDPTKITYLYVVGLSFSLKQVS